MPSNSLERMLAIMELFDENHLEWAPEEIMEALGYKRSTLYRYLKILSESGFLTSLPNSGYTIGPKIVELDYLLRKSDPLILAGRPLMKELAARFPGTVLLLRRYRDIVLCTHYERSELDTRSSYARGRPMPIFKGANAKVILSFLPRNQLASLVERYQSQFAEVGLGKDLAEVQRNLKPIRKAGFAIAHGEVTPGVYGIAAPVFDAGQTVIACLGITIEDTRIEEDELPIIADQVKFSASVLSNALADMRADKSVDLSFYKNPII